jgi:hypothetical protein
VTGEAETAAEHAAGEIEKYFDHNIDLLTSVASDLQYAELTRDQQERILRNNILEFQAYSELTLFDASGAALASSRLLTPALDEYGYGLWSYSFERGGRRYRVAKRPGSIMGANAVLYRLLDLDATVILLANTNRTDLDQFAQRIANVLVQ